MIKNEAGFFKNGSRNIIITALTTTLLTTCGWLLTDRITNEARFVRLEESVSSGARERSQLLRQIEIIQDKLDRITEKLYEHDTSTKRFGK